MTAFGDGNFGGQLDEQGYEWLMGNFDDYGSDQSVRLQQ